MADVLYEEDFRLAQAVCARLYVDANAKAVFLIDRNGQTMVETGETTTLDVTSLASLAAGNVAATGAIAKLLHESEFAGQFHEGKNVHVMLQLIAQRLILVVLFDGRSSQGLVRLRIRRAHDELVRILESMSRRAAVRQPVGLGEISDEDIENLFRD